jgi:hypothetical protein
MSGIARRLIGLQKSVRLPSFVASTVNHLVSPSISLDIPSEAVFGDYLLAVLRTGNARQISSSSGFTHLAGASSSQNGNISVYGKQYLSSDSSPVTFTRNGPGGTFSAILAVFRDADIDVVGNINSIFTAPSINATQNGFLVAAYTWNATISFTSGPSGMDELSRTDFALGGGNLMYGQEQQAGSTGNRELVASAETPRGVLVHLRGL